MKHSHYQENHRNEDFQQKHSRSEFTHPTTRPVPDAETSDDSQSESKAVQPTASGQGTEALSDQQRLELRQSSERNKDSFNPIQSFWPTSAA